MKRRTRTPPAPPSPPRERSLPIASFDTRTPDGFWVETGTPGAVIAEVERVDGVVEAYNGAGSLVGVLYPAGVDGLDALWQESF